MKKAPTVKVALEKRMVGRRPYLGKEGRTLKKSPMLIKHSLDVIIPSAESAKTSARVFSIVWTFKRLLLKKMLPSIVPQKVFFPQKKSSDVQEK